ncbi:MAG: DUF3311 domain-containing protein [Lentisphaerales bacterium]|nr:DUF3311 domain-containing protein [Lentisphaerales bacterium]
MTPKAKKIVLLGVVLLMVLHHDFWLWDDKTLVFGFLPSGLAWHAGYSVVAATFWILVMNFAGPHASEVFAAGKADSMSGESDKENDK